MGYTLDLPLAPTAIHVSLSQPDNPFNLPVGALVRLGKGFIYDMTYSPMVHGWQ